MLKGNETRCVYERGRLEERKKKWFFFCWNHFESWLDTTWCLLSSVFCRSTNLNACGESVSTLTRCSPLNPQPQPLHQPLPTQVTPGNVTSEQVHEAPPIRDRDHHALHLDNRDYESVFIIERRNSKPNIR